MRADSVFDEPHLRPPDRPPPEALDDTVWDEPVLLASARPPPDIRATYAGRLAAGWSRNTPARAWGATLAIALAAGPFAVLIAMLKTRALTSGWAAVVAAPFVEELAKAALPLLVVETRPHRLLNAAQPWIACLASGLVFSALENLLYIHVYFVAPDPAAARFRWIVCTAMHAGCSCIAGLGVRRVWLRCRTTLRKPEPALASVYLIVAMVVHGLYNLLAIVFN